MARLCSVLLAIASGLAFTSSAGAASGRKAQVIVMSAAQPIGGASEDDRRAVAAGEDHHDGARIDDLRRFFDIIARDASHARVAGAGDDPLAAAAGRSAIVVPLWMQPQNGFVRAVPSQPFGCLSAFYRPSGLLSPDAEARRRTYYDLMVGVACEQGVPVGLFDAMIMAESRYNASALSPKSAYGLTQLMPSTATSLGVDRFNLTSNLRGGARYLRMQIDRFGEYHLALAAYNAGPGRVRNGRIPNISETKQYVARIMRDWTHLVHDEQVANADASLRSPQRGAVILNY